MFWYNHDFWNASSLLWSSIVGIVSIVALLLFWKNTHAQERKTALIYTVLISTQFISILFLALLEAQEYNSLATVLNLFYGINLLFSLFIPLPITLFAMYSIIRKYSPGICIQSILCFISTLLQFIPVFGLFIAGYA